MTQHRLVHCAVTDLLDLAVRRHPLSPSSPLPRGGRRWFTHGSPPGGAALCWAAPVPGPQHGRLICWLEVEPGATGVLAHLTVAAVPGAVPLPPPLTMIALHAFTVRELAALAREAEAGARAA